MLSRNVQLAFNQFAIDSAQAKGIDLNELMNRLSNVTNDNTANHILNNYASGYRYSIATRQKELTSIGWIYTTWKYFDLITGALITDVVFLPGLNELETGDVVKIVYIKPKVINILPNGDGGINIIPVKEDWRPKKTITIVDNTGQLITKEVETTKAGFDTKNILMYGLIAGAIYMVMK